MIRSLLIGLDGSRSGIAALELGVRWAGRTRAKLFGLTVTDAPADAIRPGMMYREPSQGPAWRTSVAECPPPAVEGLHDARNRFGLRCGEAGVDFEVLEQYGSPHVQILLEAQEHDLVLLGRDCRFGEGWEGEPGQTVELVLHDSPRPVVAVPDAPVGGDAVLIAYDGSLQASCTLAAFEESGLAGGVAVHLVSVAAERRDAVHRADRALAFLASHGIGATPHVVETSAPPAEAILRKVRRTDAGLLVMGAYGQPVLRECFLGSVTRTMLRECPVPLFLFR